MKNSFLNIYSFEYRTKTIYLIFKLINFIVFFANIDKFCIEELRILPSTGCKILQPVAFYSPCSSAQLSSAFFPVSTERPTSFWAFFCYLLAGRNLHSALNDAESALNSNKYCALWAQSTVCLSASGAVYVHMYVKAQSELLTRLQRFQWNTERVVSAAHRRPCMIIIHP